jgi:hypothetical protein
MNGWRYSVLQSDNAAGDNYPQRGNVIVHKYTEIEPHKFFQRDFRITNGGNFDFDAACDMVWGKQYVPVTATYFSMIAAAEASHEFIRVTAYILDESGVPDTANPYDLSGGRAIVYKAVRNREYGVFDCLLIDTGNGQVKLGEFGFEDPKVEVRFAFSIWIDSSQGSAPGNKCPNFSYDGVNGTFTVYEAGGYDFGGVTCGDLYYLMASSVNYQGDGYSDLKNPSTGDFFYVYLAELA